MKIQYPGVADSIESDVENVKRLLTYTNLLPEKLYIDNAMKVEILNFSIFCYSLFTALVSFMDVMLSLQCMVIL